MTRDCHRGAGTRLVPLLRIPNPRRGWPARTSCNGRRAANPPTAPESSEGRAPRGAAPAAPARAGNPRERRPSPPAPPRGRRPRLACRGQLLPGAAPPSQDSGRPPQRRSHGLARQGASGLPPPERQGPADPARGGPGGDRGCRPGRGPGGGRLGARGRLRKPRLPPFPPRPQLLPPGGAGRASPSRLTLTVRPRRAAAAPDRGAPPRPPLCRRAAAARRAATTAPAAPGLHMPPLPATEAAGEEPARRDGGGREPLRPLPPSAGAAGSSAGPARGWRAAARCGGAGWPLARPGTTAQRPCQGGGPGSGSGRRGAEQPVPGG